jgi:hypothetical protein
MSKINQLQAAALKAPAEKTIPVKAALRKAAPSKPVTAKAIVAKTTAPKTIPAKLESRVSATKVTTNKMVIATTAKAKATKLAKEKVPKLKMERDSFTMPKAEYAQIHVLKERLAKLGQPVKKSELLRAGIMQLTAMTDAALKAALSKVPTIKTGRPNKK